MCDVKDCFIDEFVIGYILVMESISDIFVIVFVVISRLEPTS